MPRPDVIGVLTFAMVEALEPAVVATDADANEVISAMLTVAYRAVAIARRSGGDMARLRTSVERILLECTDFNGRAN